MGVASCAVERPRICGAFEPALQSGWDIVLNPKLLPRKGARTAD